MKKNQKSKQQPKSGSIRKELLCILVPLFFAVVIIVSSFIFIKARTIIINLATQELEKESSSNMDKLK